MKRANTQGAFWTQEEDEKLMGLVKNGDAISKANAVSFPGRTQKAVRSRASKIRQGQIYTPVTQGRPICAKPSEVLPAFGMTMEDIVSANHKLAEKMIGHYRVKAARERISTHHAMIRCNFNPMVVAAVERSMAA